MHAVESFHDILGDEDAGKIDKATYNAFFRVIHQYLNRQREEDFLRLLVRFSSTEGTQIIASQNGKVIWSSS